MARDFRNARKEPQFKSRWYHRRPAFWLRRDPDRAPGTRAAPEVVRLDAAADARPSGKPPVRIFVGTEPAQYRAERVFVWSVLQHRDPGRTYEIHLMKDLAGFDRRGWKTGFTHYRYAIPYLSGGAGRAIYNDVDQIYLADPGELFDLDMGGAGLLGVTERDTSVMLINCAKMAKVWPHERAREGGRHRAFRVAAHENGLWGRLPPEWNARDDEYRAGRSKCVHFTTLQTQPWQPFPDQMRYRPNGNGEVWFAAEREADAAGFTCFTKERPSRRYRALLEQYRTMHADGEERLGLDAEQTFDGHSLAPHEADIARLVREAGAVTLLDYGAGKGGRYRPYPGAPPGDRVRAHTAWPGVRVTCYDPGYGPFAEPYEGPFDGVISTDVLEHIPEEDIAWVLDEIFSAARKFVYVVAACYPARKVLPSGENAHCTVQPPDWWRGQLELAERRHPGIAWTLCTVDSGPLRHKRRRLVHGGEALASAA